jgi:L-aspartate oxidase
VFGAGVARSVAEDLPRVPAPKRKLPNAVAPPAGTDEPAALVEAEVRRLMWEKVGLVRSASGLREALASLDGLARSADAGSRDLVTVARLVATAALARPESRGAHFRSDHPAADPAWRRRVVLVPEDGAARVETEAVAALAEEACA